MVLEEVLRPENGSAPKGVGMCVGPVYSAAPTFLGKRTLPELAYASKAACDKPGCLKTRVELGNQSDDRIALLSGHSLSAARAVLCQTCQQASTCCICRRGLG